MTPKLTRTQVLEKYNLDKDLSGLDLRGANLQGADLSEADLSEADLSEADLTWANLRGADIHEAYLSGANLRGANLRGADLSGSNLSNANLRGADLHEADLNGANLHGANLIRAIFFSITGKTILTFSSTKHFAYYADGIIRIGCESKTPEEWLINYKDLAKKHDYNEAEIQDYLAFIKICIERVKSETNTGTSS